MKRWLNILIIVCVLLTTSSLKAEDLPKTLGNVDVNKLLYGGFSKIQVLVYLKNITYVTLVGSAEKIGFDENKLTDYLKLKVKNNFSNIKIEDFSNFDYPLEQIGLVRCKVWTVGDNYPIAYHILLEFLDGNYNRIQYNEILGHGSKEDIPDTIRDIIARMVEDLAILFFQVRGEL